MPRRIMLIPAGRSVGLTTASLGLVRAMHQQGLSVNFFKPVAQPRHGQAEGEELSSAIVTRIANLNPAEPIRPAMVEDMMSKDKLDELQEEIIARYENAYNGEDITVIEGLVSNPRYPYAVRVNRAVANALDARMVLVANPGGQTKNQINDTLEIVADNYGGHRSRKVMGCIFNKIGAPLDEKGRLRLDLQETVSLEGGSNDEHERAVEALKQLPIFHKKFSLLGAIRWEPDLLAPRVQDLRKYLHAEFINAGDYEHRRLRSVHFCAREIHNMVSVLKPGALLVISADRSDVIVSACLAAVSGTKIGALLLTGSYEPAPSVIELCQQAFATGLPVMRVPDNTWQTALNLQAFNLEIPADDDQRLNRMMDHTASCIESDWITTLTRGTARSLRLSPPAFRYKLVQSARAANKTIVLPEGDEPRTIKAAAYCAERDIATCILLGEREEILRIAEQQGVELGERVQIVEPESIRQKYVAPMVELRKHKGLTDVVAEEQLLDNVVLGTMMLQQGDVDGLVSGAVNTTANTIRPALQLVKTAPGSSLVSSIFFMLLPEQVLVYGDCAINPDPDAEQLADIAIQSADSAKRFGIDPKVAMISYSTGESGTGADVEKVKAATKIAQQKRPDLTIDGPLQYDAAIMENVAQKKAPNSPVAGQATVFIFPDLNTGNTTYKAVQRSADLVSIGPMLQGMNKPVNDLSRGALVDDIVFTIALTAIQAGD
ncbi:phosphate acetyltransferase [Marinibactrum halimedae]|uniref:Phosphate acetyltransferase n=1 Tax=Marinibactrum halimedae TaxID=1444977 RepID=A0AA37WPE1_9GAMM|nr:phosphate acetyltransferase [Marinibactrum halimedae]MCD9458216.1 phosphate acetyltransferase [Marinibactrum halimedae]GLS27156.1 phosphate acetyltransferase [Marinibactrum halimedae]